MKVLLAVGSEQLSKNIADRYVELYNETISYKTIFYFDALVKEVREDKSYDIIVISEENMDQFKAKDNEQIDNEIFNYVDTVTDEVQDSEIIFIGASRRSVNDKLIVRLFNIGVYNILLGNNRGIKNLCEMMKKPKTKREAKEYLQIDAGMVSDTGIMRDDEVDEGQMMNILNYYERFNEQPEKWVEIFDNIASQYSRMQLKVIMSWLPENVRERILLEPKYHFLMANDSSRVQENKNIPKVEKTAKPERKLGKNLFGGFGALKNKSKDDKMRDRGNLPKQEYHQSVQTGADANQSALEEQARKEQERKNQEALAENARKEQELRNQQALLEQAKREQELRNQQNLAQQAQKEEEEKRRKELSEKAWADALNKANHKPTATEDIEVEGLNAKPQISMEDALNQALAGQAKSTNNPNVNPTQSANEQSLDQALAEQAKKEQELRNQQALAEQARREQELQNQQKLAEQERQKREEELNRKLNQTIDVEPYKIEKVETASQGVAIPEVKVPSQESVLDAKYVAEQKRFKAEQDKLAEEQARIREVQAQLEEERRKLREEQERIESQRNQLTSTANTTPVARNYETTQILPQDYKKLVVFVGANKAGTSFMVNAVASELSNRKLVTGILDMTKDKSMYYIYNESDKTRRRIAAECMNRLSEGEDFYIQIAKNLKVYTSIPGGISDNRRSYKHKVILETVKNNNNITIVDADFTAPIDYFEQASEIYLVQDMDILKIQDATTFLREMKNRNIDLSKVKVIVNKYVKNALSPKAIVGGLSCYKDPEMTFSDTLLPGRVDMFEIPYNINNYVKYTESLFRGSMNFKGYSADFTDAISALANQVYGQAGGRKGKGLFG